MIFADQTPDQEAHLGIGNGQDREAIATCIAPCYKKMGFLP
jgi:hypothetical protein